MIPCNAADCPIRSTSLPSHRPMGWLAVRGAQDEDYDASRPAEHGASVHAPFPDDDERGEHSKRGNRRNEPDQHSARRSTVRTLVRVLLCLAWVTFRPTGITEPAGKLASRGRAARNAAADQRATLRTRIILRSPAAIRISIRSMAPSTSTTTGTGCREGVWIDVGFPVQTAADGRSYKPLAAILCIDLDGRLNVNAHGNIADVDQYYMDSDASTASMAETNELTPGRPVRSPARRTLLWCIPPFNAAKGTVRPRSACFRSSPRSGPEMRTLLQRLRCDSRHSLLPVCSPPGTVKQKIERVRRPTWTRWGTF